MYNSTYHFAETLDLKKEFCCVTKGSFVIILTPETQTKETRKTQVAFSKLLAIAQIFLGIYYKVQATVCLKRLKIKQNVHFIQGPIVSLNSFYNMNCTAIK